MASVNSEALFGEQAWKRGETQLITRVVAAGGAVTVGICCAYLEPVQIRRVCIVNDTASAGTNSAAIDKFLLGIYGTTNKFSDLVSAPLNWPAGTIVPVQLNQGAFTLDVGKTLILTVATFSSAPALLVQAEIGGGQIADS